MDKIVSQMPLTLHVSDSNDKKVGNSTWITTSESAKKTRAYGTDKFRHVRRCRLITSDWLLPARARTHVPQRVINKTLAAYVTTPTWPHTARPNWHVIHDNCLFTPLFGEFLGGYFPHMTSPIILTPKRHFLGRKHVIWAIQRKNRCDGSTWARDREKKTV